MIIAYTRVEELYDWFNFFNKMEDESTKMHIRKQIDCLADSITLTATMLHPIYGDLIVKSNGDYIEKVIPFLLTNLDEKTVDSYFDYYDKRNIFKTLSDSNVQSPTTFWRSCEMVHTELTEFALKIIKIPSFANKIKNTNGFNDTFGKIQQEKIIELHNILSLN